MRLVACCFTLVCALLSGIVLAKEPPNLAEAKHAIVKYHDSGEYHRDIEKVIADAMRYLKLALEKGVPNGKKPAIVLDIDETALSNYNSMVKMSFGGSMDQIQAAYVEATDPVIAPTLKLYRFAKDNKVAVFFITGRREAERDATVKNLQDAGYRDWDGLAMRSGEHAHDAATVYKSAERGKIEAKGYQIILNVGDQKSDLTGTHTGKGFKLPGPFYFVK